MRYIFLLIVVSIGFSGAAVAQQCPAIPKRLVLYDSNENGCLDADELRTAQQDMTVATRRGDKPPPKPAPVDPASFYRPQPVFIIRDAYASKAFLSDGEQLSDEGGLVSYARDYVAKAETWVVKGSAMAGVIWERPSPPGASPVDLRVTRTAFLAGVEADRTFKNNMDSGSTSFKAGFELEAYQGAEIFRHYLKGDVVYTTDFDGKASLFGFEALYQPMFATLPIGKTFNLAKGVWIGFRPTVAADFVHVEDNGSFKALTAGDDYLWLGTKITGTMGFDHPWLKPLTLSTKYNYLVETLNSARSRNIDYWQTTAKLALVPDGSIALEARYTSGNAPRTLIQKDDFYAGLAVRFGELPAKPE